MHIAAKGAVSRSIYAAFCGVDYAAYWDKGQIGIVIARRRDGLTIYVQGDDARRIESELDAACTANPDGECDAVDRVLAEYEAIEEWSAFEDSRCYPSSDLMLLNYY
jgi:hypothetical protein